MNELKISSRIKRLVEVEAKLDRTVFHSFCGYWFLFLSLP